jgi:outer membrane protein TolC
MKKIIVGVVGVCSFLLSQTLTLQDAISKTLSHHPDAKAFMLKIKQAQQGYNKEYAAYLPQVDLSATYTPTQTYTLQQNGFSTVDDDGFNASVSLHQKIWDFAKTSYMVEASLKDIDIAKLSSKEVKALLAYKVKALYELLVVQKEAIKVRQKDLEAKKAFYKQALALFKQGLKTDADTSRFMSAVYNAQDELEIAKASYQKAKISLSLYMGVKLDDDLKLQSSAVKKYKKLNKRKEQSEVLKSNYKLKMDNLAISKGKLIHKSTQASQFGEVDLVASHSRIETLNDYDSDYVGISYHIPLYTGGSMSATIQQAKIGYQIAQEQKASDLIAIKEELFGLFIDIQRYNQTIKAKKAQIKSTQKNLKLVSARYKEGLATYIEVLDSTTQLLAAKLGLLEAYYSKSLAFDRIDYLKGKIR